MEMSRRKALPRTVRGGRQTFFDDPAVDKLVAMVLALSGEVWVLRERLAAVEGVAAAAGTFTTADVERYAFSPEEAQQLGLLRREFLGNLFRVLDEQVEAARVELHTEATRSDAPNSRRRSVERSTAGSTVDADRARTAGASRRSKKAGGGRRSAKSAESRLGRSRSTRRT